jgi:hypothetical protein
MFISSLLVLLNKKMNLSLKNCSFCKKLCAIALMLAFVFSFTSLVKAQTNINNDFVLEPGKVEIFANPGDVITKTITVTNRASSKVSFQIEVEDFIGSNEADKPVILLGNEKSPYSFKDSIIPDIKTFSLDANTNITIPIKINIPANAQPGGFYTSVLVSNQPTQDSGAQSSATEGKTKIISRVGTLFFIRVNGVAKESGALEDLRVISPTDDSSNLFKFNILFKNDGNVHLVPYGWVTVNDMFGKMITKIPVDAYFAMPQSIRYREVEWNAPLLFGKYSASVELNRGYGSNLIDTREVSFWVIPWKMAAMAVGAIVVLFIIIYAFFKKFKLVAKQ